MGHAERIARPEMPQIIFTQAAVDDLVRLRAFLLTKSEGAAEKAKGEIIGAIKKLATTPEGHRPVEGQKNLRDLIFKFGASGYIARYHYERDGNIVILRIRHQKETGFSETASA